MLIASPIELWSRATRNPLAASLAISLAFHTIFFGLYKLVPDSFLAGKGVLSRLLANLTMSKQAQEKQLDKIKQLANQKLFEEMERQLRQQEVPMTFVEVDPALAAAEPPKEARFYSSHNAAAANPDAKKDLPVPKIDGQETRMVRLFENAKPQPRPVPQPLQPDVPKPPEPLQPTFPPTRDEPTPPPSPEAKPNTQSEPAKPLEMLADRTLEKAREKPDEKKPGGETLGDMAMAKPRANDYVEKTPGSGAPATANPLIIEPSPPARQPRPRTLAQAAQQNPMLAGRLMKEDGGVRNRGHVSIDVKGSPFGAYDAAFIAAVQERWYQLLENTAFMLDRHGRVVLDFRLRSDGRITDMGAAENAVGEILCLLCQRAVLDPAPYARWPGDMRRMVGSDVRDVRFTFHYD